MPEKRPSYKEFAIPPRVRSIDADPDRVDHSEEIANWYVYFQATLSISFSIQIELQPTIEVGHAYAAP
jgi:hypothetical protein